MQKTDFIESKKNIIIIFGLLLIIGLTIRLHFTPFGLPISLDAIDYFAYAVAMSREGIFPSGYLLTNFGWPSFISIFFTFVKNADMLTLMDLQSNVQGISINMVIFDEVLDSLDAENADYVCQLLKVLTEGKCIQLISHTLRDQIEYDRLFKFY